MSGLLPVIEVVKRSARIGCEKQTCCYIYLIIYNGQIHEGGWAKESMARDYADKLFSGAVIPKLLVKV